MLKIRRKYLFLSLSIVLLILLVLWAFQFEKTNRLKYSQQVEVYEMGEMVEIGENFFVDDNEKLDGYSIRVNGAKLVEYQDFIESNGEVVNEADFSEAYPMPKYIYLLNITMKNTENTEGSVMALKYALYHNSLQLPVDFTVWGLIDENFEGYPYIKVKENTEAEITVPFVPMAADLGMDAKRIESMMEEDPFYFCICEFPIRKMIKVTL